MGRQPLGGLNQSVLLRGHCPHNNDIMKRKYTTLLLGLLLASAGTMNAQVENQNQPTTLDATWTEIPAASAQSDGDLHLAGKSKIDFTVRDKTSKSQSRNYAYWTKVEVRNFAGVVKAARYYKFNNANGNLNWQVSDDEYNWSPLANTESVSGSLSVENGETGDYLYMEVYNRWHCGAWLEVILTTITSTTTRYDLYDNLPLFGSDTGQTPTSNRIQDHCQPIDVYVHRTIAGNGAWSTLCLPFDMTDAQVKKSLGANVVYSKFTRVTEHFIDFTSTHDGIEAGKPYLIQNNGSTIDNFFADNVTFSQASVRTANEDRKSTVTDKGYYYVGLLEPTKVNEGDAGFNPDHRAVYIANANNGEMQVLKELSADGTIKAFRAYLVFPGEGQSGAKAAGAMRINLDDMLNIPAAIEKVRVDGRGVDNCIYSIHGTYVGTNIDILPKGIYVRNGKKIVKK